MTNPTACREQWEAAFKEYAAENELKLREYHDQLFGWLAACEWMNTRANEGEAVAASLWIVSRDNLISIIEFAHNHCAWGANNIVLWAEEGDMISHPRATSADGDDK